MQNHSFYIALAYGAALLALLIEVTLLWRRCRKLRATAIFEEQL